MFDDLSFLTVSGNNFVLFDEMMRIYVFLTKS